MVGVEDCLFYRYRERVLCEMGRFVPIRSLNGRRSIEKEGMYRLSRPINCWYSD